MSKQGDDSRRREAKQEAALWLERLERTLKPEESEPFKEWLKIGLHREVILDRCNVWHGPEILGVLRELIPIPTSRPPAKFSARYLLLAGIAAVYSVGLLIALWPRGGKPHDSLRFEQAYRTPVGPPRKIRIPDGTEITLNTASYVSVSYGPRSRDVTLVRGEATFDVAKDASRSFRVYANRRRFDVETESTRFNIRRLSNAYVEITVLDGTVSAADNQQRATLSPEQVRSGFRLGEHSFSSSEGGLVGSGCYSSWTLQPHDVTERLAWQNGLIILADKTLEDGLAEIERYTTTRFEFSTDELRTVHLSAEFRLGDVDTVLRTLHDALQIGSRPDAGQRFVLFPLASQQSAAPLPNASL